MTRADEPADLANQHANEEADQLTRPPASIMHEAIRQEGVEELRRSAPALAWSGLAAGLSMGASLLATGLLQAHLPETPWRPVVSKLGYSVGFLIVVLGRQQLFTENTLTAVLPLLHDRDPRTLLGILKLWAIVLATNLLGALAFAWAASWDAVFEPGAREAFVTIGADEVGGGFTAAFLGAVFAGWLIALMVWLLPGSGAFGPGIIILLTYLIGLGGLPHVIAGSVGVFHAALAGAVSWEDCVGGFLLPTFLGNVLGGVGLVALLNHGQAGTDRSGPGR